MSIVQIISKFFLSLEFTKPEIFLIINICFLLILNDLFEDNF